MKVIEELLGEIDNSLVHSFTLTNDNGLEVSCINYGCAITKIITPDKNGTKENIVLGYDSLEEYVNGSSFLGCVVGRIAGRIGNAEFELDGEKYILAKNENCNHLHGGVKGFDKVIWDAAILESEKLAQVEFSYTSPDGEEGYPGNLKMKVIYTLNNNNEFTIHYEGISDRTTILNVSNHSYFNLSGDLKRDIQDHTLMLKSDRFLDLQEDLMPTGKIIPVEGTTFDFRNGRKIRTGIESNDVQNRLAGGGYDHPFVLNDNHNQEIMLEDSESGRTLTIETNEVGVVVYTASQLPEEGEIYGVPSRKYLGICLETQGLPDAVNKKDFPSWVLEKNKPFSSITKFYFGVK
ncbi:aldose epimerase family protein [Bacillus sp. FSL K6-3431]|uniref:aldose epimerase family protein n=1 Tax=Bacillus sp. FSL K6-3431 TaxID=2921500 RepID=UPI0030FA02D5